MGSGSRVPRTMVVIQIPCRARSIFIRPPREFTSVASPPRSPTTTVTVEIVDRDFKGIRPRGPSGARGEFKILIL